MSGRDVGGATLVPVQASEPTNDPLDETGQATPASAGAMTSNTGDALVADRTPPHVGWLLTPIVMLVIVSYTGDALAPQWFDKHPAWLLALNSRSRNLAIVTEHIDTLPYYAIGAARLLLSDPLFFLLGLWYGDSAISWLERRTPSIGQFMRNSEGWFSKASYPLVFIAPNNPICLLAGASGMSVAGFFIANVTGTFTRLFLIRQAGEEFESPLGRVTDFISEYRLPLTVLTVAWAAWSLRAELAKGRANEASLADLAKLDDTKTADADTAATDGVEGGHIEGGHIEGGRAEGAGSVEGDPTDGEAGARPTNPGDPEGPNGPANP